MVTENYNIRVKTTGQADLNNLTRGLGNLGTAAKLAAGAFAAIGVTKVIKGFVQAGRDVEELGIRLKLLLGSAEEGAKAFDLMNEFAAKVPFTLESIAASANNLAVVSDDAEELQQNLELTANIAAAFGLDMQTAGEQLQRALSGGIAAADIFREKGVSAFAGFQQGVSYSVEETEKILMSVYGPGGTASGALDEFAGTLTGQFSMIQDAFGRFQKAVASGFFDELKTQFGDLQTFLQQNEKQINEFGRQVGEVLANGIRGTAEAIKFVKENIDLFVIGGKALLALGLIKFFNDMRKTVLALNVAMASNPLGLAVVGIATLGSTAALYWPEIKKFFGGLFDGNETAQELVDEGLDPLHNSMLTYIEDQKKAREETEKLNKAKQEQLKQQELISDAYEQNRLNAQKYNDKLKYEQDLLNKISQSTLPSVNTELGRFGQIMKDNSELIDEVNKSKFPKFNQTILDARDVVGQFDDMAVNAFNNFSDALANAMMTGKFNFQDFARSVISDLTRIIAKQLVLLAIQKALGFFGLGPASLGGIFAGFFAQGGQIPRGQYGIVGEQGPELVQGPANVTPIDGLDATPSMMATPQGEVQVVFNINTVDARGFDDLLLERRGVITTIINQALNRQGKAALV